MRREPPEVSREWDDCRHRIEESGLRSILSDTAIMFLYLTLGAKMWKEPDDRVDVLQEVR